MLLLLDINFLHLILPVALLLAGWPPPLPRTHPFHRGEGGWCYDHDHGRGGGGGGPGTWNIYLKQHLVFCDPYYWLFSIGTLISWQFRQPSPIGWTFYSHWVSSHRLGGRPRGPSHETVMTGRQPTQRFPQFFSEIKQLVTHSIHVWHMYTYIYHKYQPNLGKYTIHGSYGECFWIFLVTCGCHMGLNSSQNIQLDF